MWPKLALLLAGVILLVLAAPFLRDVWAWHQIRSDYTLDATDRAALDNWQGSPQSFIVMLHGHCMQVHSDDPRACAQYQ